MRGHMVTRIGCVVLAMAAGLAIGGSLHAQEGEADLNEAIDLKFNAQSPRDFDKIAELCESAIEKGLEESSVEMAKNLWSSALLEYAKLQSRKILEQIPPDRRWQFLRQQAMSRLNEAIEIAPDFVEAHLLIARLNIMLPRGDKEAAQAALAKVLELSDDNPGQQAQSLVLRSQLTDDPDQQLADLDEALRVDSENAMALRLRGEIYLEQRNFDKAIADFRALAKAQNDNPATFLLLATTLAANEQMDEAIRFIDQAIEVNPDIPEAYKLRAQLHLATDNDDAALADAEKTLELNPRDPDALLIRANVLFDKREYEDALKAVDKLLTFRPGLVRGIYLRSFIHAQLEQFDRAIDDMKLLADSEPDNPQWQNDLAMMYNAAERPRKAIEIYSHVLDMVGDDPRALRGRGDARLSTGEHKLAIEDYERALKLDTEDDGLLNNLAWVLATSPDDELRDGQRSIELGTKACELTEYKKPHILSTLASGYAEIGDFEKAKEWAEKAVALAEDEEQRENLQKELESYQKNEPWRERQTIEDPTPEHGDGDLKTEEGDEADKSKDDKSKDDKTESDKADKDKPPGEAESADPPKDKKKKDGGDGRP